MKKKSVAVEEVASSREMVLRLKKTIQIFFGRNL